MENLTKEDLLKLTSFNFLDENLTLENRIQVDEIRNDLSRRQKVFHEIWDVLGGTETSFKTRLITTEKLEKLFKEIKDLK